MSHSNCRSVWMHDAAYLLMMRHCTLLITRVAGQYYHNT